MAERAQAAVNFLEHSQYGTLLTVLLGKPGETIPKRRLRAVHIWPSILQMTGGRGVVTNTSATFWTFR